MDKSPYGGFKRAKDGYHGAILYSRPSENGGCLISLAVRTDMSNCGLGSMHHLQCEKADFEDVFKFLCLFRSTGLPCIAECPAISIYLSMLTLSGNQNSTIVRFAKWCSKTHPRHISLNRESAFNVNSGNKIVLATFYPKGYVAGYDMWDEVVY